MANEIAPIKADVLIVGAGVIGLASAYELSKAGAKVVVIDKFEPGYGCSYGNAGWITPCFAMPLPMPGMLLKSFKWLLDPESPLYIKPELSPTLISWLMTFMASMTEKKMLRSVDALTAISIQSLKLYQELSAKTDKPFSFEQKGLFMVAQTDDGLKYARKEMELVSRNGIPGKLMLEEEARAFEPSLTKRFKGGVFFSQEAHAEPLQVTQTLAHEAKKLGAVILAKTEVIDFQLNAKGIAAARTTRGIFEAEQFVLATGSWSHHLGQTLELKIPVLGGKGYAIITDPLGPNPQRPMMLVEKKVAVTPRNGTLRLAGTLELVNQDETFTTRRVEAIVRGAREFMNVPENIRYHEIWRGLRPCTPDGVPVIGRTKRYPNLLLATGHQMLGLQSATGTGKLVSDLALGKTPDVDPQPFRADRF
ncbi:MAG: NAD(P)/FAD-dependent oxidoreductase [Pseudobdellovibrio sp.]